MKKSIVILTAILCFQLSLITIAMAVEDCCDYNSPGNPYTCGVNGGGNCVWWARYRRPEITTNVSASGWYNYARGANLAIGQTPVKGSIVVWNYFAKYEGDEKEINYGHVAYVENVKEDGTLDVSEMMYGFSKCVYLKNHPSTYLRGLIGYIYPVGNYANYYDLNNVYYPGFHKDGTSQAFLDAYNRHKSEIGHPNDNGGDVFVHLWASPYNSTCKVYVQFFLWVVIGTELYRIFWYN